MKLKYIINFWCLMLAVLAGSSSFGQTDSVFIINKGLPLTVSTGGSIFIKNGRYIQDDSENIEKLNLEEFAKLNGVYNLLIYNLVLT